jgi:RHS repeat-associated protein
MFKYNYLTLPQSVQFRRGDRIEYVYDAAGVKRKTTQKVTTQDKNYPYWSLSEPAPADFNTNLTVTTEYFGNKVYVNNQLKYVLTEEGYIEKVGSAYTAHYYLNDRLGNHRVVIDTLGAEKQVNHYYPSGISMTGQWVGGLGGQPYKFGGKELDRFNTLDFYDFEARSYDPALMRFTRPDPLAEKYPGISPWVYCKNNTVNRIDPDGRDDYFSNAGVFLRRDDKKTDFIWIETKTKDGAVATTAITETRLSNKAIKSVVGHYNSQLDKSDGAKPEVKIETVYSNEKDAAMQVPSFRPTTIQVNYRRNYKDGEGMVNEFLNTVANMKNTLVHERKHVEQNQKKDNRKINTRELDAIDTQRKHSTWEGTTEKYKDAIKDYEDKKKQVNNN